MIENNNARQLKALEMPVLACKFNSRLIGFQTGIAEEAPSHAAFFANLCGHGLLQIDAEIVRTMNQMLDLILERGDKARMIVSDAIDGNAGKSVEITVSLGIRQPQTLALFQANRQRRENRQQMRTHVVNPCQTFTVNPQIFWPAAAIKNNSCGPVILAQTRHAPDNAGPNQPETCCLGLAARCTALLLERRHRAVLFFMHDPISEIVVADQNDLGL